MPPQLIQALILAIGNRIIDNVSKSLGTNIDHLKDVDIDEELQKLQDLPDLPVKDD